MCIFYKIYSRLKLFLRFNEHKSFFEISNVPVVSICLIYLTTVIVAQVESTYVFVLF